MALLNIAPGSTYENSMHNIKTMLDELLAHHSGISGTVDQTDSFVFRGANRVRISDILEDLCAAANVIAADSVVFKELKSGKTFRTCRKPIRVMLVALYAAWDAEV